jgi:hypothetical protein
MRSIYRQSIEEEIIDQISLGLRLFTQQQSAYRFLCPYCQIGSRTSKGKHYAKGDAKGYLYQKGNAWNFKCHKSNCPTHTHESGGKSFEKFLVDHFPKHHFEYVRRRDELGLTGYQTNCPSVSTILKQQGVLSQNHPVFSSKQQPHTIQQEHPSKSPTAPTGVSALKVTKLPPIRSPQQQAGHQSGLNHLVKEREKRRREREGW